MSARVQVSIGRDEIVTTKTTIAIEGDRTTKLDVLARAVSVRGADGKVSATRTKNSFRWKPLTPLAPGRHVLDVDRLGPEASASAGAISVPFVVVDTPAKVPSTLRIEAFNRVRFTPDGPQRVPSNERASGEFVDFIKAEDRRTRRPVEIAVDQDGKKVDGAKLLAEAAERQSRRTGGLHPSLFRAIDKARDSDQLLVDVWVEIDTREPSAGDRPRSEGDVPAARKRALEERRVQQQRTDALAERLKDVGSVVSVSRIAPVVTLKMPAGKVKELARMAGVAGVLLCEEDGIEDLGNSIAIAGSGSVHAGGETGSGVDVAVWERGPTSASDLPIAGRFDSSPTTSNHSQNVHAIIANTETGSPDGHAPDCNLHSANSFSRDALDWAVGDRECTVVNQSFHRASEPGSGELSSDDIYGDYLAVNWPYPTIIHAAGNFWSGDPDNVNPPSSEFVNHKGYNTISVGNHNDDATAMATGSVFRNPTSSHGDRELPEISANGVGVTADNITMGGTSMASPAVAGIAALLQGTDAALRHWPEACRAILLASATRNITDSTWWQDVQAGTDALDGSGAVNAAAGHAVARHQRWRDAPATRHGWHMGSLGSSDFDSDRYSTFSYKVAVPESPRLFSTNRVKVALCWTSDAVREQILFFSWYTSKLSVDLDLKVYDSDGNQVASSTSWDNSYEIAEFVGTPGETYEIRIRRWSGTQNTWFGIAWTVDSRPLFVTHQWENILDLIR